jgi:hypothetical protein
MTPFYIPLGTSEPQDFALKNDGEPFDGTGFDLDIEVYASGEILEVEYGPTVTWLSQGTGTVRVTGVEGLEVGTYLVRFRVTDSDLKIGYFPNGKQANIWSVVPIPNPNR